MINRTIATLTLCLVATIATSQTTLQQCQQAAERNYPLIRQYDLIARTTDLTVSNIGKAWLPQVSATAQATWQSAVTAWPEQMKASFQTMGIDMKGLRKDQYRVGIDVQQTVFDGGAMRHSKEMTRRQGELQTAETEVTLYAVRKRVSEMYFGLLLIDEQLNLNADLQELLAGNERKLRTMFEKGTASESDYLNVKAERLAVVQQRTGLEARRKAMQRMLEAFCGMEVKKVAKPVKPVTPTTPQTGQRPELKAIAAQLRLVDAQERALDAALMPRLGVFAQGWYGYPGLNMFEDMMHRQFSWNGVIGTRLSWNIGALYTRKNDKAKMQVRRETAEVQRDVFLFNNHLEQIQQNENIGRYSKLTADDEEIIKLRSSIRRAAESKLAHGIIDVNDLVREINAENSARVQKTIHEIEMLKEIEDLKHTTNN